MRNRKDDEIRKVEIIPHFMPNAEGSCLIKCGNTHVICTASVETRLPIWLRNQGKGWITAEYGMLPRATSDRVDREAVRGKQTGRTQEIQRLIGRALRSVCDLKMLGEHQIKVDCDVISADGGTRVASITGAWLALYFACQKLVETKKISAIPLLDQVAAISCGIVDGKPVLDLDYSEDSNADADCNFVLTAKGKIVEIQATAEEKTFSPEEYLELFSLAQKGCAELIKAQRMAMM